MFNQYTYKQKTIALGVIILLLGVVAYKRAVSQTLQVLNNIEVVEEQLSSLENSDQKKNQLMQELHAIESIIGISSIEGNELQLDLINAVSKNNQVELYQFPVSHEALNSNVRITTLSYTVKGTYWDLVRFIYNLEKDIKKAKVVSVKLEKIKSYRTQEIELYATIYFQNYEMV